MTQTAQDLREYRMRLRRALRNPFLGTTLDNFATAYPLSRAKAFEGMDLPGLIEAVARSKDAAIPHLEELFDQFKTRAEAAGAKVHVARTAQEANRIIATIAHDHGVARIVKGKSMTAEETFLNKHLESEGFQVTETDLGEWIIQLRQEGPSHMVLPAIHLSRREVAELFTRVTGRRQDPDDINGMVKVARGQLRQAFLEADMGITGANFAIAQTGTLGLITNEGNGRLVTTLPRIHVVLVGFDKLVPDLMTALRILRVLPRSATGQAISTYVTWITGATPCSSAPDGRKELHIVFLDNGRLALAKDPLFASVLRCIRCGACANVCPIYRLVGGHNYGHVYIGAIGLILTYFYHGRENARAIVRNCLNCQACKAVCPTGIDLPHLIKEVYRRVVRTEHRKPAKNMLLAMALKDRRWFHFLLRRAHAALKPLSDGPYLRHLPMLFGKEHQYRRLPMVAATPLRDRWRHIAPQTPEPRYRVALFAGCLVDFVYPEQAEALLGLMKNRGVQIDFPMDQTCCGLPAKMMGENETARAVAIQNLKAIDPARYDFVLTLCASCGSHIKDNYPKLLAGNPALQGSIPQMTSKIIDFSSFMVDILQAPRREISEEALVGKVAYHAPCHLCRGMGVTRQPRELLRRAGLNYVPGKDEDVCCGFGGSYSVEFPEVSAELLRRKLANVAATGAEVLVTDCPGCVLQLRGGMEQIRGGAVAVKHLAEAVAEAQRHPSSIARGAVLP